MLVATTMQYIYIYILSCRTKEYCPIHPVRPGCPEPAIKVELHKTERDQNRITQIYLMYFTKKQAGRELERNCRDTLSVAPDDKKKKPSLDIKLRSIK